MKLNNINLSNENIVLLATCRPGGTGAVKSLTRVLNKNKIDWENLFFKASFHCVLPAVYNNLAQFYKELVPERYLEKFRNEYIEISKKSLFLSSALIDLVSKLDSSGIKSASFKGPTLSYLLHNDITMRDFSDLDILIRKDDIENVYRMLESSGYVPQFNLSEHFKYYYENSHYYYMNFIREDKKVALDVHWATNVPNYSFSSNYEYFEKRIEQIKFLNHRISTLAREDLFIELCIHGAKHLWSQLNWICDIAELCDPVHKIDIDAVINRSKELKCSGMVCSTLQIADKLFNCFDSSLEINVQKHLSSKDYYQSLYLNMIFADQYGSPSRLHINLSFPLSMDCYRDKFLYFYYNFMSPTPLEFSIVKLSRGLFILYYPLRILRLFYRQLYRIFMS